MPGLINRTTNTALPLTASEVTSCVSGYAFGMTASLIYGNSETHPFEGLFVYPLDEYTTVVGFEAVISERVVTVQIKDKARIDDNYFDCCSLPNGRTPDEGRIVLDEDLERIVFVANVGIVAPQESVSICISTSSELQTLPSGAVRVILPPVCVPKVPQNSTEAAASNLSGHHLRLDRHYCGSATTDQPGRFCLARLLETEATNPTEYDFSFYLEIRGPCLLAGVESPTHEIRADAEPSARSAKSIVITLANKHTFDRPVEILIHPSEPHMPHILMEEGDMSPIEYEQHLKGRNDFIKGIKKDPSAEKKTEIIRKRLHKDIPHHPVVMLNFCPNLKTVRPNLRSTQGEFIFLVDRSGSMSGVNINRVKDALLVILKSLLPTCLFNIIGFGSTFKALFPSSQTYGEENLAVACESIKKIRADMGGTNILSPLKWIIRQPIHRGHPRLLFLLTDGAVSNTGKVIELARNHSFSTRCFTFGIGQNACRRLVNGLAAVSKGHAEFLLQGERLQPKMIKSLKKAMSPVVSDISVDWVFPETTEVLISPVSASCLFPGDRLVGYSVICDTSLYISNPRLDKRRRYSMLHSQESGSSVFFHSQEEGAPSDNWSSSKDPESGFPLERSPELLEISGADLGSESDVDSGLDTTAPSRRRAYSTNQIADRQPFWKVPTASDPSSALIKNPLRKAHLQDLSQLSPEGPPGQFEFQPFATASPPIATTRIRGVGARRPSLLQQGRLSLAHNPDSPHINATEMLAGKPSHQTETNSTLGSVFSDGRSPGDVDSAHHPSFNFETETSSDWEVHDLETGSTGGSLRRSPRSICKVVVKGLQNNEPVQWEIAFDIGPLFQSREKKGDEEEDLWNETFHHLAAKSVIRDFEQLAERETEIEHGSGRRYHVNAVHTSKACNVISKYTAFLPVDLSSNSYLPTVVEYSNAGPALKPGSQRISVSESRRHRASSTGLGGTKSTSSQDGADDGFHNMNAEENNLSPCSTPSSSGWDRYTFPDVPLRSPSVSSQKSLEGFFAARLTFNKTRLLTRAARGFMGKSPSRTSEPNLESENQNADYLPLVSLQLACGSFLLNKAFCEAINIPLEKLKRTSPFTCHRMSLSLSANSFGSRKADPSGENIQGDTTNPSAYKDANREVGRTRSMAEDLSGRLRSEKKLSPPAITIQRFSSSPESSLSPQESQSDSGRGSETESSELQAWLFDIELQQQTEPEGMFWATAVALAWLEHSSASYFIEWELVAAKASLWLSEQVFPEGRSLAAVKAAAQQLFVLLRHWDENLEFNVLCYNPNNV
ncbi:von Willebrand factor A domain-containing protein 5B1 [Sceloporus undulatus]|uniref:von Willebrand factor A domain-containing protein 5B1 n=1 Tax=Sceloporus undulatus TaxID=8520 RepID=UPI001C4D7AB4|nr:von Willebrand factor A domain-containing protein 5B1 [Sceloporus undulatus]XP_042333663.1 von Willebrand factor A domain-containing protein 5B1 [Sceloporus undulatus]XP_042333664.1 von Willebrand factor A domain-containing protein 5B1 [Sceloporus undulatus]XP_042333665.1 von Willebrand factor A domain-containing protein 5B1 [Sceloporus undulatus]